MFRQGDVLLVPCTKIPKNAVELEAVGGKLVLAEGEATGHAHTVPAERAQLYAVGALMYLAVARECYLRHQEHGEVKLPVENFQVIRQREHTPWGERRVQD